MRSRNKRTEKGPRSGGWSGGQTKRLNARSIARFWRATGGKTRRETAIAGFILGLSTCRLDEWIVKFWTGGGRTHPARGFAGIDAVQPENDFTRSRIVLIALRDSPLGCLLHAGAIQGSLPHAASMIIGGLIVCEGGDMKAMISRLGPSLALLIALAGCDNKPSEGARNTTSASSGTAAPKLVTAKITDACHLLTRQEVAAAMGTPVSDGEDGSKDKGDYKLPWPSCTWNADNVVSGGVTVLIKPAPDNRVDDRCQRLDGLGSDACAVSDADTHMWEMEALIGDQMLGIQFVDNKRDIVASKDAAVSLLKAALARVK